MNIVHFHYHDGIAAENVALAVVALLPVAVAFDTEIVIAISSEAIADVVHTDAMVVMRY